MVAKEYLLSDQSAFNISSAIEAAAENGSGRVLEMLLEFRYASLPVPSDTTYNHQTQAALRSGDENILGSVLIRIHQPSMALTTATIVSVCQPKSAHMIALLPDHFSKENIDTGYTRSCPLFIAIRFGSRVAINALLDSDRANVKKRAYLQRTVGPRELTTPVEYAIIKKRPAVLELLLSRGADVDEWPLNKQLYNVLRNHRVQETRSDMPEWKAFILALGASSVESGR